MNGDDDDGIVVVVVVVVIVAIIVVVVFFIIVTFIKVTNWASEMRNGKSKSNLGALLFIIGFLTFCIVSETLIL